MILRPKNILFIFIIIASISSCKYYRGHIMFQTEETIIADSLAVLSSENNYIIQKGDRFEIKVSTNNGEMLIDPDNLLKKELEISIQNVRNEKVEYLVLQDGTVKLPLINYQKIEGLTIDKANKFLGKQFSKYYSDAFVNLILLNRRVVVFGSRGGQVIPLENENMNLLEIIALSGGIGDKTYSNNIKLIRGDLTNPNVQIIDLSTIDGMKKANLVVQANDIIYLEPKKILAGQALRENVLPYIAVVTSITNAVLLYLTLRSL